MCLVSTFPEICLTVNTFYQPAPCSRSKNGGKPAALSAPSAPVSSPGWEYREVADHHTILQLADFYYRVVYPMYMHRLSLPYCITFIAHIPLAACSTSTGQHSQRIFVPSATFMTAHSMLSLCPSALLQPHVYWKKRLFLLRQPPSMPP